MSIKSSHTASPYFWLIIMKVAMNCIFQSLTNKSVLNTLFPAGTIARGNQHEKLCETIKDGIIVEKMLCINL